MARSHHRKKHKEHLRQFKHKSEMVSSTAKSKASGMFTIVGAIIGLAVSYFGSQGSLVWILAGVVVGGTAGYFIGRKIDSDNK
jgi:NAD/NADP transhydrogenase beta subunit